MATPTEPAGAETPADGLATALAGLEAMASQIEALTASTEIVPMNLTADGVKIQLSGKRTELAAQQKAAKDAMEAFRSEVERKMSAMRALMQPLQDQMAKFAEGIWSVNLYLGTSENIVPLAGGAPAPIDTPITIRQLVLAMDEETVIDSNYGGMDFRNVAAFDEWITGDPDRLQQVLPEPRGVVAIMPRRESRDYKDPWMNQRGNELNHQTWFLIRNGERLYRLAAEDFNAGKRLIPSRDEFTGFFVEKRYNHATHSYDQVPMAPGSSAWLAAEKEAGARERHYMRVALILSGLIDRTEVFSPIKPGVSALSQDSYDSGDIVLLSDDELAIGTGRVPFAQWQREKMAQLRPGMRIVGAFNGEGWREADNNSGSSRTRGHSRVRPNNGEGPPSNEILAVELDTDGSLIARYARTQQVWVGRGYDEKLRAPKTRGIVTIKPFDHFIIPIDLVSVAEVTEYLNARTERHAYVSLIPLLRSVIAAKQAEAATEAPFRAYIAANLAVKFDLSESVAAEHAETLVDWWKFANKIHRPLVGTEDAKALRMILIEHAARARAATGDADPAIAAARAAHPDAMAVYRKRNGVIVTLAPEAREFTGLPENIFFAQHEKAETTRWRVARSHLIAKQTLLWSDERWEAWDMTPLTGHLSDPEVHAIIQEAAQSKLIPSGFQVAVIEFSVVYGTTAPPEEAAVWLASPEPVLSARGSGFERESLSVERFRMSWKRRDGAPVVTFWEQYPETWGHENGEYRGKDQKSVWRRGTVIWENPAARVVIEQRAEVITQRLVTSRALNNRRSDVSMKVVNVVRAAALEKSRADHVAEYGSDDLWEKWLSTHPLGRILEYSDLSAAMDAAIPALDAPLLTDFDIRSVYDGPHNESLDGLRITETTPTNPNHGRNAVAIESARNA